jgi:hypothetical protein
MKKFKFTLAVLPFIAALLLGGCPDMFMEKVKLPAAGDTDTPPEMAEGEGLLVISLAGANVGAARTLLPLDPQFTRYELEYNSSTVPANGVIPFYNSTLQLTLEAANDYSFTVYGYDEDKVVAKSDQKTNVDISAGNISDLTFTLTPYMATEPGVLTFSLSWDGLSRMPYRAELLIETYANAAGNLIDPPAPIEHTLIPPEFSAGSVAGSILLLDRGSAFVNLSGSLALPPGEYRLTTSVAMDPDTAPASRLDFAHIYSNLTTPAPFFYGDGDLYISNTSPDSGASFITAFTFEETPNATTVIGSEPGLDGTRMIMIMVPNNTTLTALTPSVTTAAGSVITSPLPPGESLSGSYIDADTPLPAVPGPVTVTYGKGEIDFTGPTIWTAQAKNGAVQKYTVVVSKAPDNSDDKMITNFFFKNYPDIPGNIDQSAGTITVTLPYIASDPRSSLTPIVTIIGKSVAVAETLDPPDGAHSFDFSSNKTFTVTSEKGSTKSYTVTVNVAGDSAALITRFAIDGYPARAVTSIANDYGQIATDTITLRLPYGVSLKNLTPLIQYEGKTLSPVSGLNQNFSGLIQYTVTADDNTAKTYVVDVTNDEPDKDTGIFDFRVTNVPAAKVIIGQKPRQDGKIPIVIQVPFETDETNMTAAITLSSSTSMINPGSGKINFGSGGNYQEAVYTVTSQGSAATQDYVVVVSEGPEYYYVDGVNGNDSWPDYYNGGSESYPFKTLAYAVQKAGDSTNNISKIFIKGDLTAADGGDNSPSSDSAFTLDLSSATNKKLTITSAAGATLRGTSGKRVLKITGGADITFENINITGGSTTGNGGGVYITGDHNKVKFSGGNITGNTAYSGGGVYIEDDDSTADTGSEFNFMGGDISGNTATGAASGNSTASPLESMGGGGGVYVKGDALFWLASGTISGNTTKGAGGGVLVNGNATGDETGFFMSGGKIVNNKSASTTYPHGGGGAYVAKGAFEMLGGEITGNTATRQGGGVFVHWGDARFTASGNSTITGNDGVGSSKAICNRGKTELLGNARADRVYVWNYDDDGTPDQLFTLAQNAQVTGIVLAYSAENANVIDIKDSFKGTNTICTIDLEGHLNSGGSFVGELEPDWLHKKIITGNNSTLTAVLGRLPLNSFTSKNSVYNMGTHYRIAVSGSDGTFEKK